MKFIFLLFFFQFAFSQSTIQRFSLDGNDWVANNHNQSIKVTAKVPGSIYTDLIRNGILNQDPYFGKNDINYRWVANDNWTFVKTFQVENELLSKKSVFLVCEGIDTISKIYLNDVLIGTTDNMFVRYKFDVKSLLTQNENKIKIVFESAISYSKRKRDEQVKKSYVIPPECYTPDERFVCNAHYIRKMSSSFSWDWGPAFPTQGIWKSISIESYDYVLIRDVSVETIFNKTWIIKTKVHIETTAVDRIQGMFQFFLDDKLLLKKESSIIPKSDKTFQIEQEIIVNGTIKKWWPNGIGTNQQNLYKFNVTLSVNGSEFCSKQVKIGFRTIALVQNPVKPKGLTFYFQVNDLPFFAKGSNWIPAHVFQEKIDKNYIRKLLTAVKDANMNMLRVWGGGIYESDYFYEVADEFGILIWQDMMFACALYPADSNFSESVSVEIKQNIRRLQHHPSIAIWSGNNENEGAIQFFKSWKDIKSYKQDYIKLYIDVIMKTILSEDNSRPFVPSSPSNGLETEKEGWIAENPGDNLYGDVHYYNYGSQPLNYKIYPNTRFASEYGYESFPSLNTLLPIANASDLTYPLSSLFEFRQHHGNGNKEIEDMIKTYFKLPAHGHAERMEDLIYLSQIIQAMAIKTETEFYLRNRQINSKGEGFTMGALYWQLNDIWQAPTWSSIEFGGKWKMLHYYAKKMFQNLLVSPYENDGQLMVSIVRDDLSGTLEFDLFVKLFKWSSFDPVKTVSIKVSTNQSTSNLVYQQKISDLLNMTKCKSRNECMIQVEISNLKLNLYADNFLFLEPLKNAVGLTKPNLKILEITKVAKPHNSFLKIKLQADHIAPFVWFDLKFNSKITGTFSENGFLMLNNTKLIQFTPDHNNLTVKDLTADLTVKSLTDVVS